MPASEAAHFGSAILICDLMGKILRLSPDQSSNTFAVGELFYAAIDHISRGKANAFLKAVRENGTALDWQLVIRSADGLTLLHFGGYLSGDRLTIVCSNSRDEMLGQFEILLRSTIAKENPPPDSFYAALIESRRQQPKDDALYDEISRLNNELINAHRELARRNAELARSIERRDQILGVVAHDLRNPLNVISLASRLLDDSRLSGTLSEAQQKALARIRSSTEFMTRLVGDLLDHASIESASLKLNRKLSDLVPIFQGSVAKNADAAVGKKLRIELEVRAKPLPIYADCDRVNQILDNLIGNAIKFSPPEGLITITIDRAGTNCITAIRDEGPGIPPNELTLVFEPFRRGASSKLESGAGLGLTISRALIEAHGGRIWVESEPGRGTVFFLSLPLSSHTLFESVV
jgi:two-component system, OmpR family, sensor kinase